MDIKTFVSEALTQIIQGVEEAQAKSASSAINPAFGKAALSEENNVEFDIAVTMEKGTESKAGIAVLSGMLGAHGRTSKSDTTVSRIKFSVPIAFCLTKKWPAKH
jgi:hypothetical protein